jgi:predicted RNA methylase
LEKSVTVKTRQISPEVREILAGIEWDGNLAKLTCGQIKERKLYEAVNDVLETLGGKWNRKAKAHVFESEEAALALEETIETGEYHSAVDVKQALGQFDTPAELAAEVVRLAGVQAGHSVLEPSAGLGNLIKALLSAKLEGDGMLSVTAVELDASRAMRIAGLLDVVKTPTNWQLTTSTGDFLKKSFAEKFDRVIMNPPFAKQADVEHVTKAWELLKPGGVLVAIMSPGWTFRTNAKSLEFRELVEAHGSYNHNPENAFAESGTNVKTVMVTLVKPR